MDPSRRASPSEAELLNEVAWVQRVARGLVDDLHQAEDLAQESLLAALRQSGELRSPRRFLSRVSKNLAYLRLRRRDRRLRYEADAARAESLPSTLDALERRTTHAAVVDAVHSLPSYYGEVLLLRYFEDLTPTAIGGRLGVPVSTVKTRLARAQAKLRDRLDRANGGDGKGWLRALAPLLDERRLLRSSPSAVAAPVVAWLALAVAAAAVLGFFWLRPPESAQEPTPRDVARGTAPAEAESPVVPITGARSSETGRVSPAPSGLIPPALDNALQPGVRLQGRVLDMTGRFVPGVVVRIVPEPSANATREQIAMTGAGGVFTFERYWPGGRVEVVADEWANVLVGETNVGDPTSELTVVVAPPAEVRGAVVDARGRSVAGAACVLALPEDHRAAFRGRLGRSRAIRHETRTDEAGRFTLTAPRVPGVRLVVSREGYTGAVADLDDRGALAHIVLAAPEVGSASCTGRVVDASGAPRGGALVSDGRTLRTTGPDGGFAFEAAGVFRSDHRARASRGRRRSRVRRQRATAGAGPAATRARDVAGARHGRAGVRASRVSCFSSRIRRPSRRRVTCSRRRC